MADAHQPVLPSCGHRHPYRSNAVVCVFAPYGTAPYASSCTAHSASSSGRSGVAWNSTKTPLSAGQQENQSRAHPMPTVSAAFSLASTGRFLDCALTPPHVGAHSQAPHRVHSPPVPNGKAASPISQPPQRLLHSLSPSIAPIRTGMTAKGATPSSMSARACMGFKEKLVERSVQPYRPSPRTSIPTLAS